MAMLVFVVMVIIVFIVMMVVMMHLVARGQIILGLLCSASGVVGRRLLKSTLNTFLKAQQLGTMSSDKYDEAVQLLAGDVVLRHNTLARAPTEAVLVGLLESSF